MCHVTGIIARVSFVRELQSFSLHYHSLCVPFSQGNCPTKVEWKPVSVKICFRVLAKNDNQCNSLEKTKQIFADDEDRKIST